MMTSGMSGSVLALAPEAQRKLEQLFRACDTSHSGHIGRDELGEICSGLGIARSEADALFLDLDCDGDGQIDFNDFAAGFREFVVCPANNRSGLAVSGSELNGKGAASTNSSTNSATPIRIGTTRIIGNAVNNNNNNGDVGNRVIGTTLKAAETERKRKEVLTEWKDFLQQLKQNSQHVVSLDRIRELDTVVSSSSPPAHLVSCFEQVFRGLVNDVQRLQKENHHLEQTYKRERESHEHHLHQLEEEMDVQVQQLEKQIRQQAKQEADAERRTLKAQMDAEMAELQTHLKLFQSFDNWLKKDRGEDGQRVRQMQGKLEESSHENRQLRLNLADSQTNVALLRSELAQLRNQYEDKCKQLHQEKETMFEYLHEHDHLTRQLHLLHEANKRLQDMNDSLRSSMDSPTSQKSHHSFRRSTGSLKRGSILGDYALPEEQEPDEEESSGRRRPNSYSRTPSLPEGANGSEADGTESRRKETPEPQRHLEGEHLTFGIQRFMEDLDSGMSTMRDATELDDAVSGSEEDDRARSRGQSDAETVDLSSVNHDRAQPVFIPIPNGNSSISQTKKSTTNTPIRPVPLRPEPLSILPDPSQLEPTGPPDRTYKVVFAGDAAVGKSSFILRVSKGHFEPTISSTLGVDFHIKTLRVDNSNVTLQLWDTAGQERFRSITKTYFRRADGVMLLYDCTNEKSFLNVRHWMDAIDDVLEKRLPIMLCANKTDLRLGSMSQGKTCVQTEDGERLARDYAAIYLETSAKNGQNVMDAIVQLTRQMATNEDLEVKTSAIKVTKNDGKKKNCSGGCRKS